MTAEDETLLPSMALHFELGGRSFGLPIEQVRELLPAQPLDQVPDAPPEMEGLLRVRGQLVPVLELRPRLGLSDSAPHAQIVVLQREGTTLGLLLERVHAVILAEESDVRSTGQASVDGVVRGVLDHEDQLVTLLDLAHYFEIARQVVTEAAETSSQEDEEHLQQLHLTLRIDGERIALPVKRVQEILEYRGHTEVPLAPSIVTGVLNLRGAVIPVLPLATELGLGSDKPWTRVIVVEARWDKEVHLVGLLVENVEHVVPIDEASVAEPPAFGMRLRADYVSGMVHSDEGPLFMLDADRVLDLTHLSTLVDA